MRVDGEGRGLSLFARYLARQFAEPSGLIGRLVIAPWLNRIGRRLNALALKLLAPQPGERSLEVGYGGGGLLRRLARLRPARLVGVDVSAAVPRQIAGAELVRAEAAALPFADRSFDAVVSVSVLHFWLRLEPVLAEFGRVLRAGGRLVLVFEPPEALRRWAGHRHGFQLWSEADVVAAAAASGLALEERRQGSGRKPDFFVGLRFRKGAG
ncbi:class I SAM-dependent methyltransferase [uncultured Sphingomonas sp.]|uniref:class I SAM-dependent methyltransferase n=1 Tax=uncultured Sphingomonas sp. TaxID=158754 RepID=UPI002600D0A7|nr:class I SAM-dependent methyltransferase [uncultured Sphingomonas sp.]